MCTLTGHLSYSNFHKEVHCTGKQYSVIVEVTVFKEFNVYFTFLYREKILVITITFLRRLLIECYVLQTYTYNRISSKQ